MKIRTEIHPDTVKEALLSASSHPVKIRNIELIHEVCREHERRGDSNFSLREIGSAVEAKGGLNAKTLWNPQSEDYRKLIEAWRIYAGSPKLSEANKLASKNKLLQNIHDPATRIVVEKLFRERNILRTEVSILKQHSNIVVDRRPIKTGASSPGNPKDVAMTVEVISKPDLNQLEREALEHAISQNFWSSEGWREEENGRIVKDLGSSRSRTVFKVGFASAIRKILATGSHMSKPD